MSPRSSAGGCRRGARAAGACRRSGCSPFTITLLNYIGIYALVALGLVLLTGIGGIVSFGQAAFVGIAAYATAWLTTTLWPSRPGSACCWRWS